MFHSYYIIVIIIFIITTIIWKTNNQMKADVKLNKLAKLQLHMLNVRQTTALRVRHYANVILWLKFLPMGLKGLTKEAAVMAEKMGENCKCCLYSIRKEVMRNTMDNKYTACCYKALKVQTNYYVI